MDIKTADLYSEYSERLQLVDPIFRNYGERNIFSGEIYTLKVYEDSSLVRKKLGNLGKGRVLVIDGGGSLRSAIFSEELAELAIDNGWEGVVVYGCVRDAAELGTMDVGVKAINSCPVTNLGMGTGQERLSLKFAGVEFVQGHYLYADDDGMLVAKTKLL